MGERLNMTTALGKSRAHRAIAVASICAIDVSVAGLPIRQLGQWGGPSMLVRELDSHTVVINSGPRLLAIDISDPAKPTLLSDTLLDGIVSRMDTSDGFVYAAVGAHGLNNGLEIFDYSNPSAPAKVGGYAKASGGVTMHGDCAYLSRGSLGLQILDVSDPGAPTLLGGYDTAGSASDTFVSGGFAYVADGEPGLQIIDISDPTAPRLVGTCDTPNRASRVSVSGNVACVVDSPQIQVVDVADPTMPRMRGTFKGSAAPLAVQVVESYAFVACYTAGLYIVDVSNPDAPTSVGHYETVRPAQDISVSGNYAFVASEDGGLEVVDISNMKSPKGMGVLPTSGDVFDLKLVGTNAYLADGRAELAIVDVADPAHITRVGGYLKEYPSSVNPSAARIFIDGTYAYLAFDGMQIFDVSDAGSPKLVGSYKDWTFPDDVLAVGNYAFVTGYPETFTIVDVTDKTKPKRVGDYNAGTTGGTAICVAENIAYVGCGQGMSIVDISDVQSPKLLSRYDLKSICQAITLRGDFAYICDSFYFYVVDISDPTSPQLVGSFYPRGAILKRVELSGDFAYLSCSASGIRIVNISDPAAPFEVGRLRTAGAVYSTAVVGRYIYAADADDGIVVLYVNWDGDLNCDGTVTFDDIDPFVTALIGRDEYESLYPNCDFLNADINGDGAVTFEDVDGFVGCLIDGGCS